MNIVFAVIAALAACVTNSVQVPGVWEFMDFATVFLAGAAIALLFLGDWPNDPTLYA